MQYLFLIVIFSYNSICREIRPRPNMLQNSSGLTVKILLFQRVVVIVITTHTASSLS